MPDNTVHLKNVLDLPDDFIPYDKMLETPASFVKKVVAKTASPNPLKTRKQYYGRFITRLFQDKLDGDCMFDPVLSAMQRAGGEATSEMKVFVCVVYVEELQSYPFPEKTASGALDMNMVRKIATNGGIFKSYTYITAGGQDLEYGENVIVSFTDPGARKEGMFEYSLTKGAGAPGGMPSSGGPLAGGGTGMALPGGAASAFGGGFIADGCNENQLKINYKKPKVSKAKAAPKKDAKPKPPPTPPPKPKTEQEKSIATIKGWLSKAKEEIIETASQGASMAKNVGDAVASVVTFFLPKGPACPGAFPNMPSKFPLVLDKRLAIKARAENSYAKGNIGSPTGYVQRYAKYYTSRRIKAERMAQGVMIILHNTAGGRGRAEKVNGQRLGRKAGKYQTAPSQNLETYAGHNTPVHFFLDTYNAYWNWDLENTVGGGDHDLNGSRARMPAIGIEIMHLANGIIGAPPSSSKSNFVSRSYWNYSKNAGRRKWKLQNEMQRDSLVDNAFSRQYPGGNVLPPSQIAALRQCIQFIMSYLQKAYGTRIIYIGTHRNGYSGKPSCPGQYAIRHGIAPVMQSMGLRPLNFATPQTIDLGFGPRKYSRPGLLYPEAFFHDTIYETAWKGQPYLKTPFTRESGWNSMNRPLTLEEAIKHAGETANNTWYKGKGLK